MEQIISFFKENGTWLFGGGGAVTALIAVWKLFLQKPPIQQTQVVSDGSEGYQAGGKLEVHKKGEPKC